MSKQQLHKIWSARVAEFKASGQSVPAWCKEQDLKPHQLRYWLRKDRESASQLNGFPLTLGAPKTPENKGFLALSVTLST